MTIRTVHLGTGGRGRWPVQSISGREDFESVALVDVVEENLQAAMETSGLGEEACFTSLDAALQAVEADAVVVITPPDLHYEQCLEAVRSSKHVLVEKPFTKDLKQGRQIVDEADAAGLKVAVCQQRQLDPLATTLRRLIRAGTYGVPEFGLMTKFGWRPGTHHSGDDRHAYLWERGIHDLDEIVSVLGSRPVRVWADSFNPSWSPYQGGGGFHGWVQFDSGTRFGLLCTFASHGSGSSLRIECTGGAIEQVADGLRVQTPGGAKSVIVPLDETNSQEELLDGFRRYVEEGVEPPFSGRDNLVVLGLVEALGVASDQGAVLDFEAYLAQAVTG